MKPKVHPTVGTADRNRGEARQTALAERAQALGNMDETELAAAIMHLVYFHTTTRDDVDWRTALPENWIDLDDKARTFNLKILETWAENPELLDRWVDAVRRLAARKPDEKR